MEQAKHAPPGTGDEAADRDKLLYKPQGSGLCSAIKIADSVRILPFETPVSRSEDQVETSHRSAF